MWAAAAVCHRGRGRRREAEDGLNNEEGGCAVEEGAKRWAGGCGVIREEEGWSGERSGWGWELDGMVGIESLSD